MFPVCHSRNVRILPLSALVWGAILFFPVPVEAQRDNRVTLPDYQQAALYSSSYLRQFVYDTAVRPNWIGESDQFWYSFRNSAGTHYWRVIPERATKEPLFDRNRLASQLSELTRKPQDPAQLVLGRAQVNSEGTELKFVFDNIQYQYGFATEKLEALGKPAAEPGPAGTPQGLSREEMIQRFQQEREQQREEQQNQEEEQERGEGGEAGARARAASHRAFSPDRSLYVFAKGHDLYLVQVPEDELKKGIEKRLAADAARAKRLKEREEQGQASSETSTENSRTEDGQKSGDGSGTESKTGDEQKKSGSGAEKSSGDESRKEGEERKKEDQSVAGSNSATSGESRETDARNTESGSENSRTDSNTGGGDKKEKAGAAGEGGKSAGTEDATVQSSSGGEKSGESDGKSETSGGDGKQDGAAKTAEQDKSGSDAGVGTQKSGNGKNGSSGGEGSESGSVAATSGEKLPGEEDEKKELPIPDLPLEMDETALRLTDDGAEKYSFAGRPEGRGRGRGQRNRESAQNEAETVISAGTLTLPAVTWSKDSQTFHARRRDSRNVQELWVVNSLAMPRPTLQKYEYSMPGEEQIRKTELHVYRRSANQLTPVQPKWKDESYSDIHFSKDEKQLRFLRRDRLLRNVEFCSLDLENLEATCLLGEGFENTHIAPQPIRYVEESGDMIWWSERTGWGHFYLYSPQGELKNAITSGEFLANRIFQIDGKNRTLYFTGSGREPGENVYYTHLYAVQLDGSGLRLLDPGNAHHSSILSPGKRFLVDNSSRVDRAPTSVLRSATGEEILKLEETDLSRIEQVGWKMPETFAVKAADGVTDLYGNMWKPFDFDPRKKYPIIAHVYPGPQTEGTQHTFTATSGNQQLAQLGFVVIQVGHRGGSPGRAKAYGSYGYFNLRDYGLADKKAAIEQLAQRFPFIDIERVGIYGHSGGGFMTAAALLVEPYNSFFRVGVSTAGNHDNNIYNHSWSERYHGLKEVAAGAAGENGTAGDAAQRESAAGGESTGRERSRGGPGLDVDPGDYFYEFEMLNDDEQADLEGRLFGGNPDPFSREFPGWTGSGDLAFGELLDQEVQDQEVQGGEVRERKVQDKEVQDKEVQSQEKTAETGDGARLQDDTKKETGGTGNSEQNGKLGDDSKGQDTSRDAGSDGARTDGTQSEGDAKEKTKFEIHVPTNAELAANLKGHLLLVHGELDNNVHPANTLRLVDALIRANKRFDMLYLPATRHGFGQYQPYVTQRMYEFFTEHLMDDYQSSADIGEKVPRR